MSPGPRRWRRATAASRPATSRSAARSSPIWPGRGIAQVARIERTREIARKASAEIVYLITSPPPEPASPQRLLRLARDHCAARGDRTHHLSLPRACFDHVTTSVSP